jgi:hypothetical protein
LMPIVVRAVMFNMPWPLSRPNYIKTVCAKVYISLI